MKIKTAELTGLALDWAVWSVEFKDVTNNLDRLEAALHPNYTPSTDWSQGGPIIEREKVEIRPICPGTWRAINLVGYWWNGPTPLIAAMRCHVASKLGDEVEVPDELT